MLIAQSFYIQQNNFFYRYNGKNEESSRQWELSFFILQSKGKQTKKVHSHCDKTVVGN